ncbi:MAG: heavy metal translocating P-type ATPase [Clostridia bacterium]|nr:heavy metal translocating P-type ATPase [Clostridia bacterium]
MSKKQKRLLFRIAASSVLLILMNVLPSSGFLRLFLFLIPYAVAGYDILFKAVKGIIHLQFFDENFLMAIATIGAILLAAVKSGDYNEAVAVMLFYQVGELFQSYAVGKSRKSISAVLDIRPDYANIKAGNEFVRVDPNEVKKGDTVYVFPGEKIPFDGVIADGETVIDTSALTGESRPVNAAAGDKVSSGFINVTDMIVMTVEKEFGKSTASRILELVQEAEDKKSRPERFITRFSKIYTPVVCLSAILIAFLPQLVMLAAGIPFDASEYYYRALSFLVISCPCALVISVPLSFFSALGAAGKNGILIKGSGMIDVLSKVRTFVFDKTGTLTKGSFSVVSVESPDSDTGMILKYAAYAESVSSHPIAKSIVDAYGEEIPADSVKEVHSVGGMGISATVENHSVAAGSARLFERLGIELPAEYAHMKSAGSALHVFVSVDGGHFGCITLSDTVKEEAANAISSLKKLGIEKTVILTGDTESSAETVAEAVGVDEVLSGLLPDQKLALLEKMIGKTEKLAFVGDGINDAPSLARADVGFAMGDVGSDAAIEAADIVIMNDDTQKIASSVKISKKCSLVVRENIVFSIGVKLICLVLGALGFTNLWLAIMADVGVMIIAVLNSIRLFRTRL